MSGIRFDKPESWKLLHPRSLRDRCRTFNQKADRFYEGKDMQKVDAKTWGKCATECVGHLQVLAKKNECTIY